MSPSNADKEGVPLEATVPLVGGADMPPTTNVPPPEVGVVVIGVDDGLTFVSVDVVDGAVTAVGAV